MREQSDATADSSSEEGIMPPSPSQKSQNANNNNNKKNSPSLFPATSFSIRRTSSKVKESMKNAASKLSKGADEAKQKGSGSIRNMKEKFEETIHVLSSGSILLLFLLLFN